MEVKNHPKSRMERRRRKKWRQTTEKKEDEKVRFFVSCSCAVSYIVVVGIIFADGKLLYTIYFYGD